MAGFVELAGSATSDDTGPNGSPPVPETSVKPVPPFVLRKRPPTVLGSWSSYVAAKMVWPRSATSATVCPLKIELPARGVQDEPPSVLDMRSQLAKLLPTNGARPLEVSPAPAISVCRVPSVGSNAKLEIESVPRLSVDDVHLAPPFIVFQMPPFGVVIY